MADRNLEPVRSGGEHWAAGMFRVAVGEWREWREEQRSSPASRPRRSTEWHGLWAALYATWIVMALLVVLHTIGSQGVGRAVQELIDVLREQNPSMSKELRKAEEHLR